MVSVSLLNGARSSTCLQCVATLLNPDQKHLDLSLTTCHNRLGQGPERLLARGYLLHQPAIHSRASALNEMVSLLPDFIFNALTICIERLVNPETRLFKVTEEQRCKLKSTIQRFSSVLDPTFRLPSRHALTRYITSFFRGFHQHLPFIHVPTWNILEHSAETIFGISAIGAQYCFEKKVSEHLFFAGKTLLMERLRTKTETLGTPKRSSIASTPSMMQYDTFSGQDQDVPPIDTVRALITRHRPHRRAISVSTCGSFRRTRWKSNRRGMAYVDRTRDQSTVEIDRLLIPPHPQHCIQCIPHPPQQRDKPPTTVPN
jgi:hypothetical protein